MSQTAEALEKKGQPEERYCPYLAVDPSARWKPRSGLPVFRRASEPKAADAAEVERSIRAGRVPVLGITLPQSFFAPQAPWVISSRGVIRGLHAVAGVGVGRHQGNRLILIRNSWGADWGEGGYSWLDDGFMLGHLKEVLLLTDEVTS